MPESTTARPLLLWYGQVFGGDGYECPSGKSCALLANIWRDDRDWWFSSPLDVVVQLMLAGF